MKTRNFKYFFEQSNSILNSCTKKVALKNFKNQYKPASDLCWFFLICEQINRLTVKRDLLSVSVD